MRRIVVTGGAGFIGRNLVRKLADLGDSVVVIDYAQESWNRRNFCELAGLMNVRLFSIGLADRQSLDSILQEFRPERVIHLAAESHVDKSISSPDLFLKSNVDGTYHLLAAVTDYWSCSGARETFRFHYGSTDEVYGSLGTTGSFQESMPIHPNNPYAATKAAGEHLATAWAHTFGLPILITRSANNYGPWQGPDKFVPLTIRRCFERQPVLIHGTGENIRNWIHVDDHVCGILDILESGIPGEIYNIGAEKDSEMSNLRLAEWICDLIDEIRPPQGRSTSRERIRFVKDRPGNDLRYSLDTTKLRNLTGWKVKVSLKDGLKQTVLWYDQNQFS